MTGLKVESQEAPIYYGRKLNLVQPDTKPKVSVGLAFRPTDKVAGGGGEVGYEKNYNISKTIYIKTDAKVGVYSNGAEVKVGADWMTKHKNLTPVLGVEAKYLSEGNRTFGLITEYNNQRLDNSIKYKERQLQFNGKLGMQAQTNNKRLTFGMGMKMGYKAAIDKGFLIKHEINVQEKEQNSGNIKESSCVTEFGYKPESGLNGGVYGNAEFRVIKGLSFKADAEYGNYYKGGTVGLKYTF